MFCRNCGKKIPDHSEACPLCGTVQAITERQYRTAAGSRAGAALLRIQDGPAVRKTALVLEILGILLGTGGILFALLYNGADLSVGERAILVLLGGALALGFGIALCATAAKFLKQEVR